MARRKPAPPRKLITVSAAAAEYSVTAKTIRQWIAEGRLPAIRLGPRSIRIDPADLERLAQPRGPASAPDTVQRIAKLVENSQLTDDQIDRLAAMLRSGGAAGGRQLTFAQTLRGAGCVRPTSLIMKWNRTTTRCSVV